tara:strand:+ start:162 stop:482 length:321 start_codon:yes stop_codon:yes gene_type:complete
MAQVSQITVDNQGFSAFRTALNNSLNAVMSTHLGSSAPSSAVAGTIWIDNSGVNTYSLKVNDGSDNLELFSINTSTNAITLPSGVSVTETDPLAEGKAVALAIALG